MGAKRTDICGVVDVIGSTEFICIKPPHTILRIVLENENAKNIKFPPNPHIFQRRYPYRKEENSRGY